MPKKNEQSEKIWHIFDVNKLHTSPEQWQIFCHFFPATTLYLTSNVNHRLPLSDLCYSCKGCVPNQGHQKWLLFPTVYITTTSLHWYGSAHTGSSRDGTLCVSSRRSTENLMKRRLLPRTAPANHKTWSPV